MEKNTQKKRIKNERKKREKIIRKEFTIINSNADRLRIYSPFDGHLSRFNAVIDLLLIPFQVE